MFGTRPSSPRFPNFPVSHFLFLIQFYHFVCLLAPFPAWSSNYFHPLPFPWTDTLFPLGHRRRSTKQKTQLPEKSHHGRICCRYTAVDKLVDLVIPPRMPKSLSCQGYAREWRSCAMMARELRNQRLGADLHICTWFALILFFLLPTKQHTWRRDPPHRSHRILGPDTCWPPLALAVLYLREI